MLPAPEDLRSEVRRLRHVAAILIAVAFLAYGVLRLVVGLGMVAQAISLVDIEAFREPLADTATFLGAKRELTLIPVSAAQYLGYIGFMGFVLSLGAIGALANRPFGLPLIGTFLLLYAALFVNFQTINPKIYHLAVCAVMFLVLLMIRRRSSV